MAFVNCDRSDLSTTMMIPPPRDRPATWQRTPPHAWRHALGSRGMAARHLAALFATCQFHHPFRPHTRLPIALNSMQRFCVLFSLACAIQVAAMAQPPKNQVGLELFEKKIRPALIQYCYECHAADSEDVGGELLLDSRSGLLRGGETGPSIVAGKPRDSLLLRAIEYRDLEMPPDEKMPDEVIGDFRRWISLGAPDPRDDVPKAHTTEPDAANQTVDLWSLQPVTKAEPPAVERTDWPRTEIDRFVLARLEAAGLGPNADADPATLLRRIHFDLVGLPPEPEDVAAFVADPTDDHLEEFVDRLLATTQFAERWGRHWLDVARYGESAGSSRDVLMLYAWRYRDYVIDAIATDMPLDRFITEQIAGDLLPAATEEDRVRQTVATGLLAIGSKSLNGGNLTYDVIDDQIDVISKAVLGLTVSCARCHDHKFDPIPTKDYYSLAGIFLSTDTRYGGGTKRPTSVKDKSAVYLSLDEPLDAEVAKTQDAARRRVAQLNKQVLSSRKRVATLAANIPKEFRNKADQPIPDSLDASKATSIRQYQGSLRILEQRLQALAEAKASLGEEPRYALGVQDANKITDAKLFGARRKEPAWRGRQTRFLDRRW